MEKPFEESVNRIAERLTGIFQRAVHPPAQDNPYFLFKMTTASPQAARKLAGRLRELLPPEHRSFARIGAYVLMNNRVYFDQRSVFFSWYQLQDPAKAKLILGRLGVHQQELRELAMLNPLEAKPQKKPSNLSAMLSTLWSPKGASEYQKS